MRILVAKLLILLMAVHSLVPAGFMLGQTGDGTAGPTIVMCKAEAFGAPQTSLANGNTDPSDRHGQHDSQPLCPYASFGAIALNDTAPRPIALPVAYHAVTFPAPAQLLVIDTHRRHPPARAPPVPA